MAARSERLLTRGGGDIVSLAPDVGGDGDGGVGETEGEGADGAEELEERDHGRWSAK